MPKKKTSKFGLVLILLLMAALLLAAVAVINTSPQTTNAAGNITVTSGADSGAGSLRDALASAQDGDTITFNSVPTVTLNGQILFSQTNITIDGGTGVTIKSGLTTASQTSRLLYASAITGTLTLNGLTFQSGNVTGTGGAIYSGCAVTATNCTFDGNKSSAAGAGLNVNSGGDTILTGCTFSNNASGSAGGGLYSNGSIILTSCNFTDNTASNGNGGGIRAWGSVTATNCSFIGNITRSPPSGSTASGGGIWSNNNVTLNGCVFVDNIAKVRGSGVSATNGSLLIITNCTFTGNGPYTGGPADVGAIDCATRTFIFQSTITDNAGGGVYANTGKTAYLYNCIVAGNTNAAGTASLQTLTTGTGSINNIGSLIEGSSLMGRSALPVTYRQIFGLNEFNTTDNTMRVLSDGIAAGTAQAISVSKIVGYSGLSSSDRAAIDKALTALAKDQTGANRATSGNVTYGSVETGANELQSIEVVGGSTTKVYYAAGEAINLAGTLLDLHYSNGIESNVSYLEPGMTNTSGRVDMSTVGTKTIDFTFLDVTTGTSEGLDIYVSDTTTTTLTSSSIDNTSVNGESVTFYAVVTTAHPGSGVPSSINHVSFFDNGTIIPASNVTLNSLGIWECTVSLPFGNHQITANYNESAQLGLSSDTLLQTVNDADTVITVTSVGAGIEKDVSFSAYLSVVPPGSASLSGLEVTFFADTTKLGTETCNSDGSVSLEMDYADITGLGLVPTGVHSIYAVFEGSTGLNGSTSDALIIDGGNASTSIEVGTSPPTSVYGEDVTITATLSSATAGMTIVFYDNGSLLGQADTDASGVAQLSTDEMQIGSHTLLATFDGDDGASLNGSTGWTVLYVGIPYSTTAVDIVPPTEVYANSVTITATLSVTSPGVAVLSGKTIVFYDFTTIIGTALCNASGVASIDVVLPAGSHNISELFAGTSDLRTSFGSPVPYTISKSDTATALSADNDLLSFGQTVAFTATVTATAPGSGIPAGTVEFFDNGVSLGIVTLNAAGKATLTTAALTSDDHDITTEYSGNDNYNSSESIISTVSVGQVSTGTTLSATPTSSALGKEVTFMATVTSAAGVPSGMVEFYNNSVLMGTAPLDADGKAAYSTTDLEVDTHPITATYLGITGYAGSDSNTLQYKVSETQGGGGSGSGQTYYITATADQGVTLSPLGTTTVSSGGSVTYTFSAVSVIVDGTPLSPEDVAKGTYTFSNVTSSHTIYASSTAVPGGTFYLTINVVEGSGSAEYSLNGSSFTAYTAPVPMQAGSSVEVRAVADNGYTFVSWDVGSTTRTNADISFSNVEAPLNLDLHFTSEKSGSGSNNNLIWWGLGLLILIIILLLLFFLLWRRRKDEAEDGASR